MADFKIVLASSNMGKIKEITKILAEIQSPKIKVASLRDYNIHGDIPDEPHNTFMENAIHKAKFYASLTKEATLSEDSGLCIEALKGLPGVRTKEFVDECGGIDKAFLKLEALMLGSPNDRAYFNSATVLYIPTQDLLISHEAKDDGSICFPPRGHAGFAFDPIFIPEGYDKTFAELGIEEKNKISHRAKSVSGIIKKLQALLN
jgi:XTP/dITP diphosphohydrolase